MRRFVDSATGYDPASVELYDADGYPITTVHYLTDGLLKIEYGQMTENREPVITNIEFSEDYKMTDALGREVNYKISITICLGNTVRLNNKFHFHLYTL